MLSHVPWISTLTHDDFCMFALAELAAGSSSMAVLVVFPTLSLFPRVRPWYREQVWQMPVPLLVLYTLRFEFAHSCLPSGAIFSHTPFGSSMNCQ
jgi:apolipoprotein N-acyltransferase